MNEITERAHSEPLSTAQKKRLVFLAGERAAGRELPTLTRWVADGGTWEPGIGGHTEWINAEDALVHEDNAGGGFEEFNESNLRHWSRERENAYVRSRDAEAAIVDEFGAAGLRASEGWTARDQSPPELSTAAETETLDDRRMGGKYLDALRTLDGVPTTSEISGAALTPDQRMRLAELAQQRGDAIRAEDRATEISSREGFVEVRIAAGDDGIDKRTYAFVESSAAEVEAATQIHRFGHPDRLTAETAIAQEFGGAGMAATFDWAHELRTPEALRDGTSVSPANIEESYLVHSVLRGPDDPAPGYAEVEAITEAQPMQRHAALHTAIDAASLAREVRELTPDYPRPAPNLDRGPGVASPTAEPTAHVPATAHHPEHHELPDLDVTKFHSHWSAESDHLSAGHQMWQPPEFHHRGPNL